MMMASAGPSIDPAESMSVPCPRCGRSLDAMLGQLDRQACYGCGFRGRVGVFAPVPRDEARAAEVALSDEAKCIHHPTKQATAVCEGTGNYICSLCAVQVKGATYSVDFINQGNLKDLAEQFERKLVRPDTAAMYYACFCIFPYPGVLGPVLCPLGWIRFARHQRMLREAGLYSKVVGRGRSVWLVVVLLAATLATGLVWLGIVMAILSALSV